MKKNKNLGLNHKAKIKLSDIVIIADVREKYG